MSIIDLFNYTYEQNLKTMEDIARTQYESTHGMFVKHLSYSNDSKMDMVVANDYQALLVNKEIYNLITFRLSGKNGLINMASVLETQTRALQIRVIDEIKSLNQ